MISTLTGRVGAIALDALVLEVGGVGLSVRTTPLALSQARLGAELTLHTELIVREDSLTLYGFPQREEADLFRLVQSVSGIGPRIALAVLTVLEPDELRRAVAEQDAKTIARTPGIGPKVAGRMILELTGKLAAPAESAATATGSSAPAEAGASTGPRADVVEALVGLGWPERSAQGAVERAQDEAEAAGESADAAALLRSALRALGSGR